jgi:hypothetical protein
VSRREVCRSLFVRYGSGGAGGENHMETAGILLALSLVLAGGPAKSAPPVTNDATLTPSAHQTIVNDVRLWYRVAGSGAAVRDAMSAAKRAVGEPICAANWGHRGSLRGVPPSATLGLTRDEPLPSAASTFVGLQRANAQEEPRRPRPPGPRER